MKNERRAVKIIKIIGLFAAGGVGALLLACLFGFIFMHLWNYVMPDLFGIKTISFFQSVGLVILSKILFGSLKHHPARHIRKTLSSKMKNRCGQLNDFPPEVAENYDEYCEYWKKVGSEGFKKFMCRNKSNGE
ncbi:MAG: hypothetical protein KAZ87_02730 [Spirochaetes bacterium]|nr:hypothetical protein [Spirochaetota bacterium]